MLFVECLNGGKRLLYDFPVSPPAQGAIGGGLILGITWLASPEVLGLDQETIHRALEGGTIVWALILGKILTTALTLNVGGSGGIVLPICFVGATSGSILGWILGQDPSLCSLGIDRTSGRSYQYSFDGIRLRVRTIWAHQRTLPFAELHHRLLDFRSSECHSHPTLAIQESTGSTRSD